RRQFRRDRDRWPSAAEIAGLHPDRHQHDEADLTDEITWLLQYAAPVALLADGEPFTFASRTTSGRRQQFNLHLDRLFLAAVIEINRQTAPELVAVRRRFDHEHGIALDDDRSTVSDSELARPFEDRSLRRRFVEAVAAEVGDSAANRFLARAAKERVSAMVNAWRNAPIQGGVADIMLVAYADLQQRLGRFPTARPVQTVHDSIVIECDATDAAQVADEVGAALRVASLEFCPDVAPKADVDVRRSLAEADAITQA
ncbi:MAG: DNA polymerase, partial [Acidimicrobiales bacterium]